MGASVLMSSKKYLKGHALAKSNLKAFFLAGSKTLKIRSFGLTDMRVLPGMEPDNKDEIDHKKKAKGEEMVDKQGRPFFPKGAEPEIMHAESNLFKSFRHMPLLNNLRVFFFIIVNNILLRSCTWIQI
jgi:hypothetical protein